ALLLFCVDPQQARPAPHPGLSQQNRIGHPIHTEPDQQEVLQENDSSLMKWLLWVTSFVCCPREAEQRVPDPVTADLCPMIQASVYKI
uniref:Uncharacterized protein n=1 Tax=Gasterosteus aculeatus TaxID=69293 RepID=G3N4Y9_GASAC